MAACYFHARGEEFSVDTFLTGRAFSPYQVWRKGEPANKRGRLYAFSGFSIEITQHPKLHDQIVAALEFMRANRGDLEDLVTCAGVTDRSLVFFFEGEESIEKCLYLPPDLLASVGPLQVGIELCVD
jgi:hypothetical protein